MCMLYPVKVCVSLYRFFNVLRTGTHVHVQARARKSYLIYNLFKGFFHTPRSGTCSYITFCTHIKSIQMNSRRGTCSAAQWAARRIPNHCYRIYTVYATKTSPSWAHRIHAHARTPSLAPDLPPKGRALLLGRHTLLSLARPALITATTGGSSRSNRDPWHTRT